MGTFERRYTDEQRAAVMSAYLDRGIRPQKRVLAMAKAGELWHHERRIEPFDMPLSTFSGELKRERRRRRGKVQSELAKRDPMDASEALRRRMLAVTDDALRRIEMEAHKGKTDWEVMRQIARAIREIRAIPGPKEKAVAPGVHVNGERASGATTGGLAGQVLAAARGARSNGQQAPDQGRSTAQQTHGDDARVPSEATDAAKNTSQSEEQSEPGSRESSDRRRSSPLLRA